MLQVRDRESYHCCCVVRENKAKTDLALRLTLHGDGRGRLKNVDVWWEKKNGMQVRPLLGFQARVCVWCCLHI